MTADPRDRQLRDAFEALSRDAAFTTECPAPERLWAGARGELPPAEVEPLALHVGDCGACAEAWRLARDFGTPAVYAAPARAVPVWMPAAAVIVLASGLALFYVSRTGPPSDTPATVAAPPSFTIPIEKAPIRVSTRYALTWRGADEGRLFLEALKQALEPYERGDYAAAITALQLLQAKYRDTTEPAFYLGVSQLMTGNAAAAIESIEHARDLADNEQLEDVTWYLAAAYERAGRRTDARRVAQAVCDAKGARAAAACAASAALESRP